MSLTVAPPLYRLLWRLGLRVPPPHFQSFVELVLCTGVPFGVILGTAAWFLQWRYLGISVAIAVLGAVVAGAAFGALVALYYRASARRLDLDSWESYPHSG